MYLQELIREKKIKLPGLHSSKAKFQLEVPFTKKMHICQHISEYGPKLWHTLPNSIKESTRTDTFEEKLKTYQFTKAYH